MDKVGTSANSLLLSQYRSLKGAKVGDSKFSSKLPPDFKLKLSEKAKLLKEKQLNNQQPKTNIKDTKETTKPSELDLKIPDNKLPSVLEAPKVPDAPEVPSVEDMEDVIETMDDLEKVEDIKKASKVLKKESKLIEKPAVFFIGGFEMIGTSLLGDGLKDMTDAIDEARYYEWDQKGEMIEQIKKRPEGQKVVLIGHGLGGDTAVEIAQELNQVENGFRKIDLLVTLNSTGFDNDFIPQNVTKNLNFLTADNGLTDDGPNIALNEQRTIVKNFLRQESHHELDDSPDIQIEIMEAINSTL